MGAGTVPPADGANSFRTEGSEPGSCIRDFAAGCATAGPVWIPTSSVERGRSFPSLRPQPQASLNVPSDSPAKGRATLAVQRGCHSAVEVDRRPQQNTVVSPLLAIYEPTRATLLFQDVGRGALVVN